MNTKAIREALATEAAKHPCGCEFSAAPTWLQQLLDENERLKANNQDMFGECTSLRDDNYRLRKNKRINRDLLSTSQSKSSCLEHEIKQLQADKAVAVEALKAVFYTSLHSRAREIASTALERIESGEKG